MQFDRWFETLEQTVQVVAPQEVKYAEEFGVAAHGEMLFKAPTIAMAFNASLKQGARYAFETDPPDDFYLFSRNVASRFTAGDVFRTTNGTGLQSHWPSSETVATDWVQCCKRYDKFLRRPGYLPVVVAADIEQMVIYEKAPFASRNTWLGKLLAATILKQHGLAPPLRTNKMEHDGAIRCYKEWVTYYESLIVPM